jgi:hypothetical protein
MFFQPSSIQSSAVSDIKVSPMNNQVVVTYNNNKVYLYDNVDFEALLDFVCGEIESVGKFVNAYCKGNKETKLA